MKNIVKVSYLTFVLFSLIFLMSCETKDDKEVSQEEHHEEDENSVELTAIQIKTSGITFGKIVRKQISGTVKVNGVLDVPPQQMVSISVPFGGFLKNTPLLQGLRVKKGQLIAVIENPEYVQMQQDYLEAKSQFEFMTTDYERQQELAKENVNAQKTLQKAKSNYQSWQAKMNGLRVKLKMININLAALETGNISSTGNIYAPISGYVTAVNVNIGKFVNPSDVLFEIVDTEHLHAELIVFEKDVLKIKIGQRVRFVLANETDERMATVYLVGREISVDRTIRIHCHIEKVDTDLLPGMYLKAYVETSDSLVTALPDEAIIDFQGKKYIFISASEEQHKESIHKEEVPGQHFTMMEIQIGISEFGFTEIQIPKGLEENTAVVVKGGYSILGKIKNSEEDGGH